MTGRDDDVTVSKEHYDYLIKRDNMLTALEDAGVDNWGGFEDAYEDIADDDIV